jgi:hypothetical protein
MKAPGGGGVCQPAAPPGTHDEEATDMLKISTVAALAAGALAASTATAQVNLVSGDAQLTLLQNLPLGSVFAISTGDANLKTDTNAPDTLAKLTWYYRTPGNNINRPFGDLDNPVIATSGNRTTFTYTNAGPGVSGQERFNAVFTITLQDQPTAGKVVLDQRLRFTASPTNTAPRTYQVFFLLDPDLAGTVGANSSTNDTVAATNSSFVRVGFSETPAQDTADLFAVDATRFQIDTGTNLRARLNGGSADLLSANGATVAPVNGDVGAAFQWTLTLAPGESRTLWVKYGYNVAACPADFNNVGGVELLDIFAFLNAWFANDPSADFNLQGGVELLDIFAFLNAWFNGC